MIPDDVRSSEEFLASLYNVINKINQKFLNRLSVFWKMSNLIFPAKFKYNKEATPFEARIFNRKIDYCKSGQLAKGQIF